MNNIWTLQYFGGGVTTGTAPLGQSQSVASWGIANLKITRQSHHTDVMSFQVETAKVDDQELFGYLSTVGLYRNGLQWFYGFVTKIPRQGTPQAERQEYQVSGPWFSLKQVVFQQQWNSLNAASGSTNLIPNNRSRVILGSSDQGTKLDLGQVILEALNYCLSCYVNSGQAAPFQVGQVTPSLIIPYSEVTDRSCEELVQLCLRWVPDAATWVDYSTSPPTLNIEQRSTLPALSLPLGVAPLSAIPQLTARYDLVPPVVVVKYEQTNTSDGLVYDTLTVDQYPLNVSDQIPRALVQTINLLGQDAVYLHQDITTITRPIDYSSTSSAPTDAVAYMQLKHPALKNIPAGLLTPISLVTTIDPKSPDQTTLPSAVPEELVKGTLASWMPGAISQLLQKTFTVQYTGTDPQTTKLFPDQGQMLTFVVPVTATSLTTGTYETLSSLTLGEPVPVGLAQGQYNALSMLHYEGKLNLVEQETGNWLLSQNTPNWFGNNLNITGSNQSAWATMAARIETVTEDLDQATTQIVIGPPKILGLEDWHSLLRAQRGRQPTIKLDQKQDGKVATNSAKGADHAPQSAVVNLTGGGSIAAWPFKIYDTSSGTQASLTVNGSGGSDGFIGTINGVSDSSAGVQQTVSGSGFVYIQLTLNSNLQVTAVQSLIGSTVPADVISNGFPTRTCRQIGTYNVTSVNGTANANVTNTSNTGYVSYQYCGGGAAWW